MIKKLFILTLIMFIISACFSVTSFAGTDVSLVINNQPVSCDVPPMISNGRTLVPVRVLFEHLNAAVNWNETLRQVVVSSEGNVMIFNIDSTVASLNGTSHTLDAAPVIVNGRTLVPIRFISEKLGYKVSWDENTRTVYVTSPELGVSGGDYTNSNVTTTLSCVNVVEDSYNYTVNITLSSQITPKVTVIENPYRLIFDFYNVYQSCPDGNIKSSSGTIVETRWASHPDYSRVVVESAVNCSYTFSYTSANVCTIVIPKSGGSFVPVEPAPSTPSDNTTSAPVVTLPSGAPLVVIDAGHGGSDPGAVGRDENGNEILYESVVCLQIAHKVKAYLEANGVSVVMTRTSDVSLGTTQQEDLDNRAAIGNNANAHLFVSIHNNAFTTAEPSGTCVLYAGLTPNTDYGITGMDLARNLQTELLKATGLRDRGIIERPNLVVLRKTKMPAALIECAFITNPSDQQILASDEKQNDMAYAICQGILISLRQMGIIN